MNINNIVYKTGIIPLTEEICRVFNSSGIRRPVNEPDRIKKMFEGSNLVVTAWIENKLIGIARSLTDKSYCCYMSDLAVVKPFQRLGIGKEFINITKREIGDKCSLILLAAPDAMDYYPKLGFDKINNGWIIKRKS